MSSSVSGTSTATASSTAAPRCVTAIPGKNGNVPPDACNALYFYNPSFTAAIIFSVVFGILLGVHILQSILYRKKFCWVIIMGAAWETASFILRILGTRNQQEVVFAIVSPILFLLAPLWINAFDYMILGRMVYYFLPERELYHIPATRFSVIFVSLDIVSFLVQATGGVIVSGTNESAHLLKIGQWIYIGGVGVQQLFIVLFLAMVIRFHRRILELEVKGTLWESGKIHWRWLLYALYASLALISMRIIYRLIEFTRGITPSNPLPFHEVYMYCLDALPMAIALFIMCISHPGRTLIGPDSEFPKVTRKEKKAAKAAKKAEKLELKAAKKVEKLGLKGGLPSQPHQELPAGDHNHREAV
ncbi:hypothetical protein BYT27DRAFT_7237618 [Phlegmacium glaucopus]|nr:hypothetical protein BYT27DRAFT_7237618 [Phlegmacium glaucopus]